MNLTWHIMKKDLRRNAWPLLVWAVTLIVPHAGFGTRDLRNAATLADYVYIVSLLTHAVMVIAIIGAVIQEDDVTGSTAFWRTRPISPSRLLGAKLGVLGVVWAVEVFSSLALIWAANSPPKHPWEAVIQASLSLGSSILACAALASCSKTMARFILGGILCVIACMALSTGLGKLGLATLRTAPRDALGTMLFVILALIGASGLAVLLNQYFGRRPAFSVGMIAGAVVGIALVSNYWRWNFLS